MKLTTLVILICFLTGCGYVATSVIPTHIKKVYISTFKNNTTEFGIENKLAQEISKNFVEVPRLDMVEKQEIADAVVLGTIIRFAKEPISYDTNNRVEEYRIKIIVDIEFKDLINNKTLWKEQGVEEQSFYYPMGKIGESIKTEQEVIKYITSKLAKKIVYWIVKGW